MSPVPESADPAAGKSRPPLAEWFIRHPIGTVLLTIGLVLLGGDRLSHATARAAAGSRGCRRSSDQRVAAGRKPARRWRQRWQLRLEVQLSGVPGTREMTSAELAGARPPITMQFEAQQEHRRGRAGSAGAAINAAAGRLAVGHGRASRRGRLAFLTTKPDSRAGDAIRS